MPADKEKIGFVVPSLSLGGQEYSASVMANYLAGRGFDVTVMTVFRLPRFQQVDERIRVTEPPYDKSSMIKAVYYGRILFHLRRCIRKTSPRTVISYGDWSNFLVILACLGLNSRVFISDRASPDTTFQWYVRLLRRLLYPRATGIIAQTELAARKKMEQLGKGVNLKVLPNPVRPVRLYPEKERQKIILGVGRHWHVKGLDRLLEAFATVDPRGYRLLIAGSEGPATRDLAGIVGQYRLGNRVEFLGGVKDMDSLYAESRIFVLPSRNEGFPNALIESMAAGLACISFNCSAGPDEIITPGVDGILVEEGNVPELARQIQYLIDHDAEVDRLGLNALKIRERLALENIGPRYLEFLMNREPSGNDPVNGERKDRERDLAGPVSMNGKNQMQ